jgi:hypothetical protein
MGALRLNFGVLDGVFGGAGGGVAALGVADGVAGVDGDRMLLLLLVGGVDDGGRCDGATLGLLTMVWLLVLVLLLVLPLGMDGPVERSLSSLLPLRYGYPTVNPSGAVVVVVSVGSF